MRYWACDRWGVANPGVTDDPICSCSMCKARRYDRLPKNVRGAVRDRMRP